MIATISSGSDFKSTGSDLIDNVSTRGLLINLATTPISTSNVLRFGRIKSDIRDSRFRGWGGGSGGVDGGGRISKISIKFYNNIKIRLTYNKNLLLILLADGKAGSRALLLKTF